MNRVARLNGGKQILVIVDLEGGIEPALQQNLCSLEFDQFLNLLKDLLLRQEIPFWRCRRTVERAERTLDPADVGIVDRAADDIGYNWIRMQTPAYPIGHGRQLKQRRPFEQLDPLIEGEPFSNLNLLPNRVNPFFRPTHISLSSAAVGTCDGAAPPESSPLHIVV